MLMHPAPPPRARSAARTLEVSLEAAAGEQGGEAAAAEADAAAAAGNPVLQRWVRLYLSENKIPKVGRGGCTPRGLDP